jgi:hypothetical protein
MNTRSPKLLSLSFVAALLALFSCAAPQRAASQALRAQVGAYELEVRVGGTPVPSFAHAGETHILGQEGSRYVLRVHNRSARRIEAVVTVDGLDVMDGKPGDFANKRGYLVPAYGYVDIDGWRLSSREAAAFRFAAVGESYAAKTGSARNVGVIGVAIFPERIVRAKARAYAPEPSYDYREESARSDGIGGAPKRASGAPRSRSSAPEAPSPVPSSAPAKSAEREESADLAASSHVERRSRAGLGTEFGEAVSSEIRQVAFVRAHSASPQTLLGARYNDRAGLYALGIDVDHREEPSELELRRAANPFPVSRGYARPPADWRRD